MRGLTSHQKKFLLELLKADPYMKSADDISVGDWDALVEMNDTEILCSEVTRFIQDYRIKQVYKT